MDRKLRKFRVFL